MSDDWTEALKTRHPLIVTAAIAKDDLAPFDRLRRAHFPPERNVLHAHLTMFHRLPGEYSDRIVEELSSASSRVSPVLAEVSDIRNLGSGVAFSITSLELEAVRTQLKAAFISWLGPQDMRKWQPHITVQNKVTPTLAHALHCDLASTFQPHQIQIKGLDLWAYQGGPWDHRTHLPFCAPAVS